MVRIYLEITFDITRKNVLSFIFNEKKYFQKQLDRYRTMCYNGVKRRSKNMKNITQLKGKAFQTALDNVERTEHFKVKATRRLLSDLKMVIKSPLNFTVFEKEDGIPRITIQGFFNDKAVIKEMLALANIKDESIIRYFEFIEVFARTNENGSVTAVKIGAFMDYSKEQTAIEDYLDQLLIQAELYYLQCKDIIRSDAFVAEFADNHQYLFNDMGGLI